MIFIIFTKLIINAFVNDCGILSYKNHELTVLDI
jgi:hypothetical protein